MTLKRSRPALTLIELMVVIAIIGTLMALLLGAVVQVRQAALLTQSMNNLRQIDLATTNYAGLNGGRLPPLTTSMQERSNVFVSILPFLEQEALYADYTTDS